MELKYLFLPDLPVHPSTLPPVRAIKVNLMCHESAARQQPPPVYLLLAGLLPLAPCLMQRLHDELRAKEQCSTKLAARQAETAAQLRARYELERSRKLQLEQERLRLLRAVEEQKQQGREAFRERQEKLAARRAGKEARRRANTAAAAAAAAEAGSSSTSGAGTSSSAAMDVLQHGSGRAAATAGLGAAAADPVTPPASPFDSKLIHNMAASRAARAAAAAKAAASGTCCSTPAASPMTAATPAVTPAGSYTPGSLLLQQKRHAAPTPAQVHDQVAAEVEALKEKGNALMRQGQLEEAEAAYREALQLDGDNVKVLLNLALLRVQQGDGSAAVRCCDEVLAQQGLPQQARLKALVRCVDRACCMRNCSRAWGAVVLQVVTV